MARPPSGGQCRACGAAWLGLDAAHCTACCQTFATARLFDAHRRDFPGECTDPASMLDLVRDRDTGQWRERRAAGRPRVDKSTL